MPTVEQDYLQEIAETTFLDTGRRGVFSATLNAYNEEVIAYTLAPAIPCGFRLVNGVRDKTGTIIKVDYDAEARISLDQTMLEVDHFTVNSVEYEIKAILVVRTCKILHLKKTVMDS